MLKTNAQFAKCVKDGTEFNASACINCGSCTALCPLGIDLHPRTLFRYVLIGARDSSAAKYGKHLFMSFVQNV